MQMSGRWRAAGAWVLVFQAALGWGAAGYEARDGWIVVRGGERLNNRPLYCDNTGAFLLAGDRPMVRFAQGKEMLGSLIVGVVRGSGARWLHDWGDVTSAYRGGRMRWVARDAAFGGLEVRMDVVPMAGARGFAARLAFDGARAGDRLVWAYGGAAPHGGMMLAWDLDVLLHPEWLARGFDPAACADDAIEVRDGGFVLRDRTPRWSAVVGRCDAGGGPVVADAGAWASPASLAGSAAEGLPIACGQVAMDAGKDAFLAFAVGDSLRDAPRVSFERGEARAEAMAGRAAVETPDGRLDAVAAAAVAAVDGTWIPPVFVHGAMAWNRPFPGWRTIFGGTAFGWHDRVRQQARHYIDSQVKESDNSRPRSDPAFLLTKEHKQSRFYGRGRIGRDQGIYNMQSQFFDQLVHAWRWTGDAELEAMLRPALELHLEWLRECFDPDGDGCYESYINVWPTDSVWYNGGGGVEESIYAYRGHEAARDMADRAGDVGAARRHADAMGRIRGGFFERLWMPGKGHAGLYIEQGGRGRLIENAWLYSIFLPVDSTLLTPEQAAGSLHYSEWALQNDPGPDGGRRVWTSNFVPGIWSVRECWPGDNYHLALAYYLAGMGPEGWDVFRANFLHSALGMGIPGNLGAPRGGTDFGDCVHMFARALVEGLFGFRPDYPKGVVRVAPQFPAGWDRASIRTPDFSLAFTRDGGAVSVRVGLTRPCAMELSIPVRARGVLGATLGGRDVAVEVVPGFGHSVARVRVPEGDAADVAVMTEGPLEQAAPVALRGAVGEGVSLRADGFPVVAFTDPQGALEGARIRDGAVEGTLRGGEGRRTVIATVDAGGAPQWRLFRVETTDPGAEAARLASVVCEIPADAWWECVDMRGALNADVRAIYQQRYLEPRPATVSVRIGTDGYSPWTFLHWKSPPPAIGLDGVAGLLDRDGRLATPQGVPFAWSGGATNVAFTSLWKNFPERVAVPVGRAAEAAWFLVCGSTTVMQSRVANAVLRLRYVGGGEDALELVPPFNYWNLSPIVANARAPGQEARSDYTDPADAFAVPKPWPQTVPLGQNCRAILLNRRLRADAVLESVALEALSQDVVVGLMGITLMNPDREDERKKVPGGAP